MFYGALLGAVGVCAGAFGAHALADVLTPRGAEVWDTAVLYHLIHALALVVTGQIISAGGDSRALSVACWAFGLGILLFSGSLYALALNGPAIFGPITPLGGLSFIIGWLALARAGWNRSRA